MTSGCNEYYKQQVKVYIEHDIKENSDNIEYIIKYMIEYDVRPRSFTNNNILIKLYEINEEKEQLMEEIMKLKLRPLN